MTSKMIPPAPFKFMKEKAFADESFVADWTNYKGSTPVSLQLDGCGASPGTHEEEGKVEVGQRCPGEDQLDSVVNELEL